jgi:hypothetical protein
MAEQKETIVLDFEVDTKDAIVSIDSLTKANKALREERKNLNLTTEEGIKRANDINNLIDKNTSVIKANSSTLEKNRLNVGNYTESINKSNVGVKDFSKSLSAASPALDKVSGGAVSSAQGFMGMVKGALAFIATPIGAVIAALGVALSAVISYLKGSEEGSDLLAKRMDQLGAIVSVIVDRIIQLGGALVKLFTGDFIGALDSAKAAFTGIGDEISREVTIAGELADILDELEDRERNQKVALSESTLEIKRLIIESKNRNLTEQQKIDLLQKATDLEIKSNEVTKQIALDKLKATTKQIELDFSQFNISKKKNESELEYAKRIVADINLTGEARNKVADAVIALNEVEGQSLVIQEKISNQIDAQNQKQQEKIAKLKELQEKEFEKYQREIEQNRKAHESNDDLYESTLDKLDKIYKKEGELNNYKLLMEQTLTIRKKQELDLQVQANYDASQKVIAQQEKEHDQIIALIVDQTSQTIALTDQLVNGVFAIKDKGYKLQENQLAVSLSKQKTILNKQYADDLSVLNKKYESGLLSKEDYDAAVLALNQKNQAEMKDAEIKQATALNDIKKKEFEANKKNRIASAIADTAKAVISTFANAAGGLILKTIAATAAGVFAGIQVAQIKKEEFVPTTFRTGGYTGDGSPDDLAGGVHKREFVMPASVVDKYGKDHFQSYMDGSVVANASTNGMNSQQDQRPIIAEVVWSEFKRFQNQMAIKESIVSK